MIRSRPTSIGSKKDLWLRLRNYHFDHLAPPGLLDKLRAAFAGSDASTQAFAGKLTRKLGWARPFALRAIGEYKKFVYLGMVSDFPVTPARVIDQVWHEHLLFSRGYREFCGEVLGRNFDHNPELAPADEQTARFQEQYAATLELYQAEFNVEPPEAFWGLPKFSSRPGSATTPPKRRRRKGDDAASTGSDTPLYGYFDGSGGDGDASHGMPEFGGGRSGGGGADGEWSDGGSGGDSADDSTGSDGGDGGSGCSSGCGGGD